MTTSTINDIIQQIIQDNLSWIRLQNNIHQPFIKSCKGSNLKLKNSLAKNLIILHCHPANEKGWQYFAKEGGIIKKMLKTDIDSNSLLQNFWTNSNTVHSYIQKYSNQQIRKTKLLWLEKLVNSNTYIIEFKHQLHYKLIENEHFINISYSYFGKTIKKKKKK